MRARRLLPLLVVMLACLGCAAAPPPAEASGDSPHGLSALLDERSRDIISAPSAVTVYAIKSAAARGGSPLTGVGDIKRYYADAAKTPDAETTRDLIADLLDDGTYAFGLHKRCVFSPGVAVRFEKGKDTVEVLICYMCNEIEFTTASGKAVMVSFDPGAPRLSSVTDRALGQ